MSAGKNAETQPTFWAAPELAKAGYPVFPLKANGKEPSVPGGFYAGTTDISQVAEWITEGREHHNVGFATGLPSGVVVMDADTPEAFEEMRARHGEPTVRTKKGGHWYYRHPHNGKVTSTKVRAGLDRKGDGGYVAAPPSLGREWTNGIPARASLPVLPREFWPTKTEASDAPRSLPAELKDRAARVIAGYVTKIPPGGDTGRHQHLTHLCGVLLARGMAMGDAEDVLIAAWTKAGGDLAERAGREVPNTLRTTQQALADDRATTGVPSLDGATPGLYEELKNIFGWKARITFGGRERNGHRGDAPKIQAKIQTNNRHLRDVTADTLDALEASNDPPEMFVRAGALVRVREDEHGTPQIQNMDLNHVRGRADRCADFVRITKQGDNWIETRVNPPEIVVKDLMALPTWPFSALEAVVESPILRPDGSIFDAPGYDAKSRLYYRPVPGFRHPEIPTDPGKDEVRAALDLVNEAIGEFPYADKSSAANTLGLLVTLLIRQAIPGPAPLALIDAPQAGTGKTLLAEIVAMIGTGRAGEMLGAPRDDEEWRKQITSKLSAGGTLIVVDNVENALYAPSLARALTSRTWTDRVLGRSEMVTVSQRATWIATGNNISLRGDLPRRCYWIRLDAKESRPWKREQFKHPDLTSWVEKSRGELVGAVLTIARGWYAAGKPKAKDVPRLGSFEAWAEIVGGILAFAGIEGFLGNLEELYSKADEGNAEWEAFLEEWWRQRGEDPIAVKDLAKLIEDEKLLRDALPGDLSEARDKGEGSFTRRLGKAIAKRAGTRYGDNGLHIMEAGEVRRAKLWSVHDSSGGCEFVSFVSLYNPGASKNVCNEHTQAEPKRPYTASGEPETNSPNSQTHTEHVGESESPEEKKSAPSADDTSDDSVRALLEDPPDWLAKQLARCKADPERWLKPTAAAAAAHRAHGPSVDASTAESELRRWLEGGGS